MTPFVFGKLPSHGDFVCRGLSSAERERWDAWASIGLQQAEARLGSAFSEAYTVAPPWRFVLPTEQGWEAGAFAPSVDRAGRRFPIIAGFQIKGSSEIDLESAAEGAEDAIYAAFEAGEDVDALAGRLAAVAGAGRSDPVSARAWTLGGERHAAAVLEDVRLDPAVLSFALTPAAAAAAVEATA